MTGKLIEVARKAVETNIVPLWEYDYKEGRIRFTHPVEKPLPVQAYLSLIGKYKHLDEKQIAFIQEQTDRKIAVLKNFAREEKKEQASNAA
jgi:phenylglyoxylate dehydrogenase beta subunit